MFPLRTPFARKKYLPGVRAWYRDEVFPNELIPEIGALGVLGANIEGYGGAGMNSVSYGLVLQELERGDGTRSGIHLSCSELA